MRGVTYVILVHLMILKFQLTRLMRGVTSAIITKLTLPTFQLTRLMRGVTGEKNACYRHHMDFNSHASCEA